MFIENRKVSTLKRERPGIKILQGGVVDVYLRRENRKLRVELMSEKLLLENLVVCV